MRLCYTLLQDFSIACFTTVIVICIYYNSGGNGMVGIMGEIIAAIVAAAGIATTVISQILFYKKDSRTMDEIKRNIASGHERLENQNERLENQNEKLQSQLNHKQEYLTAEHKELSRDHREIKEVVNEIRTKQEHEIRLQEKLRDIVPDAGMLKDGIEKICRENAQLRTDMSNLQDEIKRLQERNQKLTKAIKKQQAQTNDWDLELEL